jgi:integrase/recombinase XerD
MLLICDLLKLGGTAMPRPPSSVRSKRSKNQAENETENQTTDNNAKTAARTRSTVMLEQARQTIATSILEEVPTTPIPAAVPEEKKRGEDDKSSPIRAVQPQLFAVNSKGEFLNPPGEIPPLLPESPLNTAKWWFRTYLEQLNRPRNTISSYMYDLSGFEEIVVSKQIQDIDTDDVNEFLTQSQKKSTRKRRLTSLGAFFKYLINIEKILDKDPTSGFFGDFIPLKTPIVLTPNEQEKLLAAAQQETTRTYLMVYFMLKLGFTRTELLAIQPEHVDISDPENPVVYIFYDDQRWSKKERKLAASPDIVPVYEQYLREFQPTRKLFEMLPQSVNKLVERVTKSAEIKKKATPQSLRDTFAVEEAKQGANAMKLLLILGLAQDPRNRMSVERYIKLANEAKVG